MVAERRAVTIVAATAACAASSDRTRKVRDNRAIAWERTDHNAPMNSLHRGTLVLLTATASSQSAVGLHSIPFVSGLQGSVGFVADPTDRTVFYAIEQAGRIRIIRNRAIVGDLLDFAARSRAAANAASSAWRSRPTLRRAAVSS